MPCPILPYDVHDRILRYLSLKPAQPSSHHEPPKSSPAEAMINFSALYAFAMASRAFKSVAYPHIFSSMAVETALFPRRTFACAIKRMSQCAQILSWTNELNSTGIAHYIKSFALIINVPPSSHQANLKGFFQNDSLADIFDALHGPNHGVESFSFIVGTPESLLSYPDISPRTRRSFENLLRSPNLKHVQLDGVLKIPRTLLCGTNIESAEFYSAQMQRTHGEDATQTLGHCQPTVLQSIGLDEAFASEVLVPPDLVFKEVKEMYCRLTSPRSIIDMIDILARAEAGKLRKLDINISGPGSSLRTPRALPSSHTGGGYPFHSLHFLSSLLISVTLHELPNHSDSVRPFLHVLEQATFPDTMGKITFDITTPHSHHIWEDSATLPSETLINRVGWLEVGALLGHTKFKHVEIISIVVNFRVTVEPNARASFDSALFGVRTREELESALSIFTAPGRQQRNITVKITVHDLYEENSIPLLPYHPGFVMYYGGRKSWSTPFHRKGT